MLFNPFSPPPVTDETIDKTTDFLLEILDLSGDEQNKEAVKVAKAYKKVAVNLDRLMKYGFVSNDVSLDDRKATTELLEQTNSLIEDFCKRHNVK